MNLIRKKNLKEIRRLVENRKDGNLMHFLVSKGVASSIAEEIAQEFIQKEHHLTDLEEMLAERIHTTGDLSFECPKKLALVGPTGVGKTTTLLKLAHFYAHQSITVTTLDPRKEAIVQLQTQWDMKPTDSYDLMLIDTEGCNFYQPNRVDSIGEQLGNYDDVDVLLTLSAAAKDVDLYGAIHQFSSLQPSGLIFTKLDETLTMGALINVSTKTDLPIRYITFGYPLPGEIHIANPRNITHKILTDLSQETFQFLRELTT